MLVAMDRDVFGRVRPLGRKVGSLMMSAVNGDGGEWNPALLDHLLDRLLSGGLHSLHSVLSVLRSAAAQPLLLRLREQREVWCQAVDDAIRKGDKRDLIIGKHAKVGLLNNSPDPQQCLTAAFREMLERVVVEGRKGLLQRCGAARLAEIRPALLAIAEPELTLAATKLLARPSIKRLRLAARHRLLPNADLLRPPSP